MNDTVKERLRSLREEQNISQEKLAAELGVTRMTIAGYELGKRPPDSIFISKACQFFNCTPDYIFGISPFKNNEHYTQWITSSNTLELGLNMLPEKYKNELISAINWLLQDNFAVNQLTSDKNYMIDKFINIIIEFTDLFRTFSDTVNNSDLEQGIEENDIFKFYKKMEASKKELINIIDNSSSDLFGFLIRHSSSEVLKNENRN